jgi:translation elongation factor EF-1alpha
MVHRATIAEALDTLNRQSRQQTRLSGSRYRSLHDHRYRTVPVGRVETGIMKTGRTSSSSRRVKGEVKTIEMHHEQITEAKPATT